MSVLHGAFYDVHGQALSSGNFSFVNATVELSGNSWSCECELRQFPDLHGFAVIAPLIRQGIDAIWVIGRIKAIFGSWIDIREGEKSILNEGFLVQCQSKGFFVPFMLNDHYLRTSILFGATLDDQELKTAIARSFYELLLASPDELVDFEFRKEHIGAGITMVGGIVRGLVQYDEEK
jgi:hypothetical protein